MSSLDDTADDQQRMEPVTLGLSIGDTVSLFVVAPVAGGGVGLALPWVAQRVAGLPWFPFQGPLELLASLEAGWGMAIGLVAGLVLGVGLAIVTVGDTMRVTVAADEITFGKGGTARIIARANVSAVFLDHKSLVVLERGSREVVREEIDAKRQQIERALRLHDYPWCAEDPYADAFARWVPNTPELPGSVNAILTARERALRENNREDARELRADLMNKGYVVREKTIRQYWRGMH